MDTKPKLRATMALTVCLGAIVLGVLLFAIQVFWQLKIVSILSPSHHHPVIVQKGLQEAFASPRFIVEAIWYFILGTLVHALLLLVPIVTIRDIGRYFGCSRRRILGWTAIAVLLFFGLLLLWNKALFPFSDVIPHFYLTSIWPMMLLSVGFIGLILAWLACAPNWPVLVVTVLIIVFLFVPRWLPAAQLKAANPNQPNVILIGIDSLRPDHLTRNHQKGQLLMPHLEQWLSRAVIFKNAVTPMARTFPALTSLLTARYPIHNGARVNLAPVRLIDLHWTLGKQLQKMGYETAFTTDAARFANFSKQYGFNIVATPPEDLSNFLFGTLIDSVGTNLLGLFPADRWLNPVEYANRDATSAYRTGQISHQLSKLVKRLPKTSAFLMVHFNIAHLPYVKKSIFSDKVNSDLTFQSYGRYERGLKAVDKQFAALLNALDGRDMLENAVVVVYSDHGEELDIKKDQRFRRRNHLPFGRLGHGGSIFSPSQNHILLAMQVFKNGKPRLQPGTNHKPALLTDVATTVLPQLPDTPKLPKNLDGINLMGRVPPDRIRYMESAVLMPVITAGHVNRAKILERFGDDFRITDNLRIRARSKLENGRLKQCGAILGNRVVGLRPDSGKSTDSVNDPRHWRSVTWKSFSQDALPDKTLAFQKRQIARFFYAN